jgi:WD40 repeat protein
VTALRLVNGPLSDRHKGEVFACNYSPDAAFVLSAGWDGCLHLWEVSTGAQLTSLRAGPKPLSACAVAPDGKCWLAGSMEGLVTYWDAHSHLMLGQSVIHTRPVSAICYSADGQWLASTAWDRQVCLRSQVSERDHWTFTPHDDVIAGCRFSPDVRHLLTWSHDRTVRLWDLERRKEAALLHEHRDRVTAGDLSPDGGLAASGSRDGELILWDLEARNRLHSVNLDDEIRACLFLLDGSTLVTVHANGHVQLHSVPDLEPREQLDLGQPAQCAALSPRGDQLAVGNNDGLVRLLTVEGSEARPLVVTATQSVRRTASRFQRLFGKCTATTVYACVCPTCRNPVELLQRLPSEALPCPHCRRPLRFSPKTLTVPEST